MITSVSTVAETMPPTMGAAMRRITSEPVPVPHMIGSRPEQRSPVQALADRVSGWFVPAVSGCDTCSITTCR